MAPSNLFSSIDPVIRAWSSANSLKMFDSFAGRDARFCYISNSEGECFQISIQAPQNDMVTVDVWTVETIDDRELHEAWAVQVPELLATLEAALSKAREWLGGSRAK